MNEAGPGLRSDRRLFPYFYVCKQRAHNLVSFPVVRRVDWHITRSEQRLANESPIGVEVGVEGKKTTMAFGREQLDVYGAGEKIDTDSDTDSDTEGRRRTEMPNRGCMRRRARHA